MTPKPPHYCSFCGTTFANVLVLTEHRVGTPRRCMTPDELREAGLRRSRVGVWGRVRR